MDNNMNPQVQLLTAEIENKPVRRSFLAGISEHNSFGTLRVPEPFIKELGESIPRNIKVICMGGIMWKGLYDNERGKIMGLEDFMKAHNIKQMFTLLVDYLGDGDFNIQIYNSYGLEVYQYRCLPLRIENQNSAINLSEYVLGLDKLEDEKARSLFFSSAYGRELRYHELSIDGSQFHAGMNKMILPKELSDLYTKWKNGDIIKLHFLIKYWEVSIEVSGDDYYLGYGWADFMNDCGIEKNDILIFNAVFEQLEDMVQVCLFKSDEIHKHASRSGLIHRPTSFFHVLNLHTLDKKEIVPPILVRKFYSDILSKVDTISCGRSTFTVSYNTNTKALKNIQMILNKYDLKRNDTFFLTTTDSHAVNMRIYRRDGLEVEYQSEYETHIINPGHWFMNDTWDPSYSVKKGEDAESRISIEIVEGTDDIGSDGKESPMSMGEFNDDNEETDSEDGLEEAGDFILGEFVATLSKSNVDTHCHGVYISKNLDAFISNWNSGHIVFFRRNGLQWQIGINVTNGRKRFSAGWSVFVEQNGLNENDIVRFSLQGDGVTFDVEVVVD